jgi:small subunit ribosomal protein S1
MVNLGDEIEVVVLNVNKERQEISLGLKQTETNPWTIAAQKYPSGTVVDAKVRSMTNFGAFVEIEPGIDGMIHISDLSWTRKYGHPSEALQKGQEIKCVVLEVNEEKRRVSLGMKQMTEDPWIRAIPDKYIPGHIIKGKVAKLTNFGAFVELEPDLEGLLHISELADHKVDKPQDVVQPGDEIEIKILKVDAEARKIGLSLRRVQWAAEDQTAGLPKPMTQAATGDVVLEAEPAEASKGEDSAEASAPAEPTSQASDTAEADTRSVGEAEATGDSAVQEQVKEESAEESEPVKAEDSQESGETEAPQESDEDAKPPQESGEEAKPPQESDGAESESDADTAAEDKGE